MRPITVVLIILLILIQYPLWLGDGGWVRVHELEKKLFVQREKNALLKLHNDNLMGEVEDLQNGTSAIEERARYDLGMMKDNELFIQIIMPTSKNN